MVKIRGWGLLIMLCAGLLLAYSCSRLGPEKARASLERYEAWSQKNPSAMLGPASQYFVMQRQLAVPGDVNMPAIPADIGVKSWSLEADTTVRVVLESATDQAVVLRYVPVVRGPAAMHFECISAASLPAMARVCQSDAITTEAGISAQLDTNARVIANFPKVISASGVELTPGIEAGTVVVVPALASDLNQCGSQCVKPQSCVTPRALACSRLMDENYRRWLEVNATPDSVRGSSFATRDAADSACAQALGAGYRVAESSDLGAVFKLNGGNEYWVHNPARTGSNCWSSRPE